MSTTDEAILNKRALIEAGVNATFSDDLLDRNVVQKAITALIQLKVEKPNISKELLTYRKYVPILLKHAEQLDGFNRRLSKTFERMESDSEEKKYQRWTPAEDEKLIELVCNPKWSMLEISTTMGRSVPAIKSRVTKLVGLKRISQEVAGKFIGTVDGNKIEGTISGTLYH